MEDLKKKRKPLTMYNIRTGMSKLRVLYLQQSRPITMTNLEENLVRIFNLRDNEISMYNNSQGLSVCIRLTTTKTLNVEATLRSLSYTKEGPNTFLASTITAKVVEVV